MPPSCWEEGNGTRMTRMAADSHGSDGIRSSCLIRVDPRPSASSAFHSCLPLLGTHRRPARLPGSGRAGRPGGVAAGSQAGGRIDTRGRGRSEQTSLKHQSINACPTAVTTVVGKPFAWCGPRGVSRSSGTGGPPNRPRRAPTRHPTDVGPPTRPPTPPAAGTTPEGMARRPCRGGTRKYDRAGRPRRELGRDFGWRTWRGWPSGAGLPGVAAPAVADASRRDPYDRAS